ncbi:hypothetical protein [Candidatus Kuenenia stuttgartiensis]|uniref:Uncharacterized protein n=1 Tax=Kuenenia stuttgartiensis TaxID=174633 RepID=A0A2C9CIJ5_KUEST|nr:hypothetical protein [Candidatus Kuenenia stuttgartiensis]SOH04587.1 hypothetical protein KSMBR1_2090 [Candidatus Kuenenia stuttgartiensis]
MDIYPIKTEVDYKKALSEIENLWGSKENTKKGDKPVHRFVKVCT